MASTPIPIFDLDETIHVIALHLADEGRKELVAAATDVWAAQIPASDRAAHYARIVSTLDAELVGDAAAGPAGVGTLTDAFAELDSDSQEEELRIAAVWRARELFEAGADLDVVLDTVLPWLDPSRTAALRDTALRIYASSYRGSDN